jgi:sialate O-acetylesterase
MNDRNFRLMSKKVFVLFIFLISFSCSGKAQARVSLAEPFGDDMVLQRGVPITVWGRATPQEHVSVRLANQSCQTAADDEGSWFVRFRPLKAGTGYKLSVKGKNSIELKGIASGDVWIFSGQSNMTIPISKTDSKYSDFKELEHVPLTMYYQLPPLVKKKLRYEGTFWRKISKSIVCNQQAIPFLCGLELAGSSKVPVGIMSCPHAGAPIETFMSPRYPEAFRNPYIPPEFRPGSNYQQLVKPLINLPVKGFIWYQGESNLMNASEYPALLKLFIRQIRIDWHNDRLPIFLVQLPCYSKSPHLVPANTWAKIRQAQLSATRLSNVFLVVTTDTAGKAAGLHPPEKKVIAHRLAMLIKAVQKGNIKGATSPRFVKCIRHHKELICIFDRPLLPLSKVSSNTSGFEIAGLEKKFKKAQVQISSGTVVLSNRTIHHPFYTRYNWADNPEGRLYGVNKLPLAPFNSEMRWHTSTRKWTRRSA